MFMNLNIYNEVDEFCVEFEICDLAGATPPEQRQKAIVVSHSAEQTQTAFSIKGTKWWYSLPDYLKCIPTFVTFNKSVANSATILLSYLGSPANEL